jgi:hypothetical protein
MSVSTLMIGMGAATPVSWLNLSIFVKTLSAGAVMAQLAHPDKSGFYPGIGDFPGWAAPVGASAAGARDTALA